MHAYVHELFKSVPQENYDDNQDMNSRQFENLEWTI